MKIRDSSRRPPLEKSLQIAKGERQSAVKAAVSKESSSFQEELHTSQKKQFAEKLKILLIEIDEEGDKLFRLRTMDILNKYRDLIKNFLKEVLHNLYLLKEESHFDPRGKYKVLVMVKSINKTLEDLVKMVLDKEVNNIKLLEKIGEIKGMLIDLYS
jgi:uncharacterized protein YaaR (DUF327 family)